jgi:glycosyltransferase involved in cell wall biosynthesis
MAYLSFITLMIHGTEMKPASLPLVSVVTPSFNQARFLEATILSVLSQDYPRLEYIIVDGGSTDGSLDIIKKYADRLAWYVSENDAGQTDAINKGFSRATGQILAWLNSDDSYEPHAVGHAVKYLISHPAVGMVYSDCNYINEDGLQIGRFPAAQTDLVRLRSGYVHIPQQTMFFRSTLWELVGPLDPSFYFAMDYDLWTRLAAHSTLQYVAGETWANFRLHTSGKTLTSDDRCWPEMLRVHYRDGGSFFSPIVAKYYLRRLLAPFLNWRRKRLVSSPPPSG